MLSDKQGKVLLKLARDAIMAEYTGEKLTESIFQTDKAFNQKQGAFVTLKTGAAGELRGCIGYTAQIYPLYKTIILAAKGAAFNDPRFPPVALQEIKNIHIDISVLSVPEEIVLNENETRKDLVKHIKIGTDGLIVQHGGRSGLLLPQVFPEWNADEKKALEMTCEKAGLQRNAWLEDKCRVLKFQAQIFEE